MLNGGKKIFFGQDAVLGKTAQQGGRFVGEEGDVRQRLPGALGRFGGLRRFRCSGKRIPARQLWSGRPATFMRDLDDRMIAGLQMGVAHYVENAKHHAALFDGLADGATQA